MEPFPETITANQVCQLFDIKSRTLADWRRGGLRMSGHGKYRLKEVIDYAVRLRSGVLRDQKARRREQGGTKNAQDELAIARREKIELELAQKREELVPLEHAQMAFDSCFVIMADALEYLGARLCNDLSSMDDPAEIQDLIWRESRDVRRLMADKLDFLKIAED